MVGQVFVDTEPALHTAAQSRYRASLPSGASVVDQVSFGVMAQASIETAFALDSDFVTAGVSIVPAPGAPGASRASRHAVRLPRSWQVSG